MHRHLVIPSHRSSPLSVLEWQASRGQRETNGQIAQGRVVDGARLIWGLGPRDGGDRGPALLPPLYAAMTHTHMV
jgi:hypothetical protein